MKRCLPTSRLLTRFSTGVTGYIGGDAFYELESRHPDWDYSVLVRGRERGAQVAEKYPNARLVYGTNEDSDIIEAESAKADIVIRTFVCSDGSCRLQH